MFIVMYIALGCMFAFLLIFLYKVIIGPSIWDRLLCFNLISSKIVIIIILFASIFDTAFLLDFAIIYALFGFISEIFIANFMVDRRKKEGEEE